LRRHARAGSYRSPSPAASSSSRRSSAAASFGPTEWRLVIPLGRLAEPADEAALALFLAGDGARQITGQNLAVDGDQTIV
jgi:NAD(P)-dependent dehydrogenase (short-subunit alcohol dehydrogenase family)